MIAFVQIPAKSFFPMLNLPHLRVIIQMGDVRISGPVEPGKLS